MPGEVIDRPNPQPLPSHIEDHVLSLAVKLDKAKLDLSILKGLQEFRRAANYIAAGMSADAMPYLQYAHRSGPAMIFLHDNILVERDLTFADIKPRLLGQLLCLLYIHIFIADGDTKAIGVPVRA